MASWHNSYCLKAIFFLLTILPLANSLSFSYSNFQNAYNLMVQGDASHVGSNIQVSSTTKDKLNSIGRVLSYQQMRLWDVNSRNLANFSTNFSFTTDLATMPQSRFVFFLIDPKDPSFGTPVFTNHTFAAVKFDTYGQNVGVNFNSTNSVITAMVI